MAVIRHLPHSPDLTPCAFFLFPKMKLKLKETRLNTSEDIEAESQRVPFKNGGDGGTGVYMREGNTSRVIAADRPYGEFYDFYSVSPEYFGYHHVLFKT
jgi:hypothetical protein